MEGREKGDPGYEDWFDEPEPLTDTHSRAHRAVYDDDEEDWVRREDEGPRRPRAPRGEIVIGGRTLTTAQVAIIVASGLALIFAILAAAGAFSSNTSALPPVTISKQVTVTVSTPATTAATPTTEAPAQTLKPGDTGAQVTILQQALKTLGFDPGKADGNYGPATQAQVEKFQQSKGLAQDGIVGQQTLAALQQALSG